MMKNKVLVLLSGGVDSVTALYQAMQTHEVVGTVSFDYGSKHNEREISYAKYHSEKLGIRHEVIHMDFVQRLFKSSLLKGGEDVPEGNYEESNMKSTVVPFRNGIMLAIACGFGESIGASGVIIGAHSGDHAIYPDCRTPFMEAMSQAMQLGTYETVELLYPFIDMDKAAIVKLGSELNIDYAQTWSCYNGREHHCGKCGTCIERKEAFEICHLEDPTMYEQ